MPGPKGIFASLTSPWGLIWFSIQLHLDAFKDAFRREGFSAFAHLSEIRDKAQAQLLSETSEGFIKYENTTVVPSLVEAAKGKILELGPGPGNQIDRYDPSKVEFVYAVDPNPGYASDIAKKLEKHELRDRYEFIPSGVEDSDILRKHGVTEGSMDTVLCIQVMCAVGDVKSIMKEVYKLLKPGGEFIFWEHEMNKTLLTAAAQAFWEPSWSTFVGCHMLRNIRRDILAAGEWENPGEILEGNEPYSCLPRSWGKLVKKA